MTEKVIAKVGNNYSILYKSYFNEYFDVRYFRLTKNRKLFADFTYRLAHDEISFKKFCKTLCPSLISFRNNVYMAVNILKIIDKHNRKEKLKKLLDK